MSSWSASKWKVKGSTGTSGRSGPQAAFSKAALGSGSVSSGVLRLRPSTPSSVPSPAKPSFLRGLAAPSNIKRPGAPAGGDAKRKRPLTPEQAQAQGVAAQLLQFWGLQADTTVRYVLDHADAAELELVKKKGWKPNPHHKMSVGEQVNVEVLKARETAGPPGHALDTVSVFKYRWNISAREEQVLRSLCHKDLRYVISEYDRTRDVKELAEEAALTLPEVDRASDAAPERPGPLTLGRFNRLELIDPQLDALILGDANLTFALELLSHRQSLCHTGRIVATTFETLEILRERYPEIDGTVRTLADSGSLVLHNVDCTRLAMDSRFTGMEDKFGAVYYNFPHAGVVSGFFDGHPFVRWRHENLMHLFFRALRAFMTPGGVVKVSSNSGATGVRYSDIMGAAFSNEFIHVETVPFLEWQLRDYKRSFGDRRDKNRRPESGENYNNQRAQKDMVYSFCYAPTGELVPKPRIRYPPAKADLLNSAEGPLWGLQGDKKQRRVEDIYELFLSYVKGIHVG